jgi:hypothetical protein
MESQFPNRVAIERKALDLVNESGLFRGELTGLTKSAIDAFWLKQLQADVIAPVRAALMHVSLVAHCDVDISDEVLVEIPREECEAALESLRDLILRMCHP